MDLQESRLIPPVDVICRDIFLQLPHEKLPHKMADGPIKLPGVWIEGSPKSAKGVDPETSCDERAEAILSS